MITYSRKLRVQEKKIIRNLIVKILFLFLGLIIFLYAGLPILAKIAVTLSIFKKEKVNIDNLDTPLLFPPILDPLPEATNSSRISLSGVSEKETSVKIFVNNKEQKKVMTDKDGKFSATNLILNEGENTINAVTIKGNLESSPSSNLRIYYLKDQPKIEISTPEEGQKFFSEENPIKIEGETDAGNKLFLNDRLIILDPYGRFSTTVSLSTGENVLKFKAQDPAGNQSEIERKIYYSP